jgi:hypothetical protein
MPLIRRLFRPAPRPPVPPQLRFRRPLALVPTLAELFHMDLH